MKIIVAGAGDVGFHLAKLLVLENHEITVIDLNETKLVQLAKQLDVITVKGNATSFSVLEEADIANADLFIAVTESEECNISTCIIAKHLGVKKTIARIQNIEFLIRRDKLDLCDLGIDEIISPELLAGNEIKRLLREIALTDVFDFDEGKLSLIGLPIYENSPLSGKTLLEASKFDLTNSFITVALLRNNKTIIPHGNDKFEVGDHAYFISLSSAIDKIIMLSTREKKQGLKRVMVIGGSKVGINASKQLSKKYNVKLIEINKEKCFELADILPNIMVIHGDARDVELLQEEGISQMDAFIAVTGNSETNIISSLVAKDHKVKKTIALVENVDYIHLSQKIGVDTMINKKLIAANFIFKSIRKGDIINLTSVHGVDAEVLEFVIKMESKITENALKFLDIPSSVIVAGVIRKGEAIIPKGDFQFRPKDRAIVLCKPESIEQVEKYFS